MTESRGERGPADLPGRLDTGEFHSAAGAIETRRAARRLGISVIIAALTLAAVLAVWQGLDQSDDTGTHRRSSYSARADGFRGIHDVLDRLGFRVNRLRRSYGQLGPPAGSVLLVIDPLRSDVLGRFEGTRVDRTQIRSLRDWIRAGGRVVAAPPGRLAVELFGVEVAVEEDAPEADDPVIPWAGPRAAPDDVISLVLEMKAPGTVWRAAAGEIRGRLDLATHSSRWSPLEPSRREQLTAYVRTPGPRALVRGPSERTHGPAQVRTFADSPADEYRPALLLDARPVVVTHDIGDGRLWLFSSSYPFTNAAVATAGTGPSLVAVLEAATDGGARAVVFDEYCHGLWVRRGLFGWILDTRLFYPAVGIALVLAIFFLRQALRLGPPRPLPVVSRRAKEEYVLSLADIALRAGRFRMAARSIVDLYRTRLVLAAGGTGEGEPGGADQQEAQSDLDRLHDEVAGHRKFGESDLRRVAAEAAHIYTTITTGNEREGDTG